MDSINSALRIRDVDKMYQISVWRRIDLRERYNLPLAGSGIAKKNGIVQHIYDAVLTDSLPVFKDENFETELGIQDFQNSYWFRTEDFDGDNKADSIFGPADIFYIDLKEDFVFDRQHSQTKFDVKYIALVMPSEINMHKTYDNDSISPALKEKTIAYFRYNDFIKYFKNHPSARWINFKNSSESKTYPQAFEKRDFRSVITRFTNENDFTVLDLVNKKITDTEKRKMQAYLDALAFEYKLLDFENSLWEW